MEHIIEKLTAQHRTLEQDLVGLSRLSEDAVGNRAALREQLTKFTSDLSEHVELENNIFYPALVQKMKQRGFDVCKTEEFIFKMDEIVVAASAFCAGYGSEYFSDEVIDSFRQDLSRIEGMLNLQIETEESGVYGYWKLCE